MVKNQGNIGPYSIRDILNNPQTCTVLISPVVCGWPRGFHQPLLFFTISHFRGHASIGRNDIQYENIYFLHAVLKGYEACNNTHQTRPIRCFLKSDESITTFLNMKQLNDLRLPSREATTRACSSSLPVNQFLMQDEWSCGQFLHQG